MAATRTTQATTSPPTPLSTCLLLLEGDTDEHKFAGLLLASKVLGIGQSDAKRDSEDMRLVYSAVGSAFLHRLVRAPIQNERAGAHSGSDRALSYQALGVNIVCSLATDPAIAADMAGQAFIEDLTSVCCQSVTHAEHDAPKPVGVLEESLTALLLITRAQVTALTQAFWEDSTRGSWVVLLTGLAHCLAQPDQLPVDLQRKLLAVVNTVVHGLHTATVRNLTPSLCVEVHTPALLPVLATLFKTSQEQWKFDVLATICFIVTNLLESEQQSEQQSMQQSVPPPWSLTLRTGLVEVLSSRLDDEGRRVCLVLAERMQSQFGSLWGVYSAEGGADLYEDFAKVLVSIVCVETTVLLMLLSAPPGAKQPQTTTGTMQPNPGRSKPRNEERSEPDQKCRDSAPTPDEDTGLTPDEDTTPTTSEPFLAHSTSDTPSLPLVSTYDAVGTCFMLISQWLAFLQEVPSKTQTQLWCNLRPDTLLALQQRLQQALDAVMQFLRDAEELDDQWETTTAESLEHRRLLVACVRLLGVWLEADTEVHADTLELVLPFLCSIHSATGSPDDDVAKFTVLATEELPVHVVQDMQQQSDPFTFLFSGLAERMWDSSLRNLLLEQPYVLLRVTMHLVSHLLDLRQGHQQDPQALVGALSLLRMCVWTDADSAFAPTWLPQVSEAKTASISVVRTSLLSASFLRQAFELCEELRKTAMATQSADRCLWQEAWANMTCLLCFMLKTTSMVEITAMFTPGKTTVGQFFGTLPDFVCALSPSSVGDLWGTSLQVIADLCPKYPGLARCLANNSVLARLRNPPTGTPVPDGTPVDRACSQLLAQLE